MTPVIIRPDARRMAYSAYQAWSRWPADAAPDHDDDALYGAWDASGAQLYRGWADCEALRRHLQNQGHTVQLKRE